MKDTHLHEDEHHLKGHIRPFLLNFFKHINWSTEFDKILSKNNIIKMEMFLKMKYDLIRSHRTTFMLWRGCVAFLLANFLIYDRLWTTFVLVLFRRHESDRFTIRLLYWFQAVNSFVFQWYFAHFKIVCSFISF